MTFWRNVPDKNISDPKNEFAGDNNNDVDEMTSEIYIETMDSLHYFLLHLYQSSLRISLEQDPQKQDEKQAETADAGNPYFDETLSRLNEYIQNSTKATDRFNRLNSASSKFNISVPKNEVTDIKHNDDDKQSLDCYLDHVLQNVSSEVKIIQKLAQFITDECYDTDSMHLDLNIFKSDGISNISQNVGDNKVIAQMIELFEESSSMYA